MFPPMPAIAERKEHKQTVADFMALGEGPPFAQLIQGKPDQPVAVLENGTHAAITTDILPGLQAPLADIFRA